MDASTIMMAYGTKVTLAGALTIYGAGVPFSAVFGAATAVFLFLFGVPFIKKIDRINTKYNITKAVL